MLSQARAHQLSIEAIKDALKREKVEEFEKRERDFEQDMGEQGGFGDVCRCYFPDAFLKLLIVSTSQLSTSEFRRRNAPQLSCGSFFSKPQTSSVLR